MFVTCSYAFYGVYRVVKLNIDLFYLQVSRSFVRGYMTGNIRGAVGLRQDAWPVLDAGLHSRDVQLSSRYTLFIPLLKTKSK